MDRNLLTINSTDGHQYLLNLMVTTNSTVITLERNIPLNVNMSLYYASDVYPIKITFTACQAGKCNNGTCNVDGLCECFPGYTGTTCSKQLCSGNPMCSGHGTCSALAMCVCDEGFTGWSCASPSNYTMRSEIEFDSVRPWCNYSIYGNLKNGSILEHPEEELKFSIKFFSVIEVDSTGQYVRDEEFGNMTTEGSATDFTMSGTMTDGAKVLMTMNISSSYNIVKYMNESVSMHNNTVKYAIRLSEYKFKSSLNYLLITFNVTSGLDGDCSMFLNRTTRFYGNSYQMPMMGYGLYGAFPNRGMLDGRPFVLTNRMLNNQPGALLSGMVVPYFTDYVDIDPDFSVLVRSYSASASEDGSNITCPIRQTGDSGRATWFLPVVVVVPVICGAVIIAAAIIIYRKSTTAHIYVKQAKTRVTLNRMSTKVTPSGGAV
ncbi:hypothetical protein SAMD00019534_074410 [Acytostelium subglobosum LB1]|uniref:hypothetical protein n=1 Tax=Acytostelium subglobosum LB1 TaxID=1410327 RepID=UPI0006449A34|nr:hypothetical protein SAMD00019534_074410 [Acytostelium subglobosum LB1]GAM24266.1 hypothetical protein SAMD00019534_074410 [Acytostelium subglobosum LB1]|eukprot:XP_012752592.1 hypothetical protein SAMD00019534_074410 [Acytostelium subglobosum LB1]